MTKREAAIVSAYTGFLIGSFDETHRYIEEVMGGPVWTHQMGSEEFQRNLRDRSRNDYVELSKHLTEEEE